MNVNRIFIACLVTAFLPSYILCENDDYSSYWSEFKKKISQRKTIGGRERREVAKRESPWQFPPFLHHPQNFEKNDVSRHFSRFPGPPSGGNNPNFENDDYDLGFDEGNFDNRARNDRGPVLFPIVPTSSTIAPRSGRNPAIGRPTAPRWPPRFPGRPMNYPIPPPPVPSNSLSSTTPNPVSISTPAVPGMQTRRPACEEACQTTPEYNPLCGTDNVTYDNMGRFNCAISCGKNIRIDYRGACPVPVRGR